VSNQEARERMMTRLWDELQNMEPGRVVCSAVVIWQMDDGSVAMATAIHPDAKVVGEDGGPSQKGVNATVANIIEHSAQELRKRTLE
jgi:hypothetical protein